MDAQRPDPDKLLKQIKAAERPADEADKRPGRLKIFFGYAAGVGKTYAMLEAARARQEAGAEVVAGYIEPHARPETLALLKGIERLPPRDIPYRGITLKEFDLDAALARHPRLILVDELAHSNAEGCRNRKRYQDIAELLRAGISVWTTVNVQHVESLNDIVASITGVVVRERVPDSVFDSADQVELVDIEPDDLIDRLHHGKIYRENQACKALANFFVPENLIALREIALRRMADRVNRRAEQHKGEASGEARYTKEHLLICLSPSPSNGKVIRTAARMAEAFHGDFTALFVETSDHSRLNEADQKRLRDHLRLAEQLGAKIVTVYGDDVPAQIAEYAKVSMVSKIIIGRSNNKIRFFSSRKNLVEQLTELAPAIDIHIIPDHLPPFAGQPGHRQRGGGLHGPDWAKTGGILVLSSLAGLVFFHAGLSEANIITVYILAVVLVSLCTGGRIYGAAASLISVFLFNFLFTEPRFTFQAYDPGYPITFLVMFLASFLISGLTGRVRGQAREAAGRAYRTEILLESSQKLQQAGNEAEILAETATQLSTILKRSVVFYPVRGDGPGAPLLFPCPDPGHDAPPPGVLTSPDEQAVARWVYRNNKRAGATTDTLPGAACLYLAVRSRDAVLAVAGLDMTRRDGEEAKPLEAIEKNLVLALLGECALALGKDRLTREKNRMAVRMEQETLRANLLRAISHDLRTPLTAISGNASILMDKAAVLDENKKRELYADISDDALWLINLVENLLAVTRIENGSMAIRMEPELLDEVIREALEHLNRKSAEHVISVDLEDDLLMARVDSRLLMQVIINIVDNAIAYTPPGSHIGISARRLPPTPRDPRAMIRIAIADDGEGIPDSEKARLFEMFYTADNRRGDGRRGLGLGLSLCQSIVRAHGGTIAVRDNTPRGTVFSFTVQAEEVPHA